jgi:multiple sugar transport system substrate-binding protein
MMASGNPPDVFFLNEYLLNEWGEKGAVEDLYPYFNKAGINPDQFYVSSALYKTGNHLWGINPSVVTICLYYNKELFRQAGVTPPPDSAANPWTWQQFVDAAKKLTRDSAGRGPNDPGFNYDQVVQYGTVTPTQNWSQIPPAKPGACFVNRSKRFVLEPPKGGYLCCLSLN